MRTHRWIRLSFLNFPSLMYSQYVTYVALFKSTISRAYFAGSEKSVPPSIFLRFTTENTHTHVLLFLIVTRGLFFAVFTLLLLLTLCVPCFLVTPLGFHFFSFFSNFWAKAADKKGEKTHKNTPLWDYFILILNSLFCSVFRSPLLAVVLRLNIYIYTRIR